MAAVLEARELWKIYDSGTNKVEALRNISVTFSAGEMVAVMGPSGCGKTTLLNCLSGLDDFTAGEVLINGIPLSTMSDREKTTVRGEQLGFIFQSFNLLPVLTAVENVELPLLMSGKSPSVARKIAMDALEAVGLSDRASHLPSELSGGQQQRVTIARAFVHSPAVILADEATGNLDTKTSEEVIDLMLQLNERKGVTTILVTHDFDVAKRCTRTLTMRDGIIVEDSASASSHAPTGESPSSKLTTGVAGENFVSGSEDEVEGEEE